MYVIVQESFLETWLNMFIAMAQTVHHLYLQPMIICSSAQTMRISYVVWVHYTHYTQKPCLLIILIKSVNSDVNDVWRTLVPWSRHGIWGLVIHHLILGILIIVYRLIPMAHWICPEIGQTHMGGSINGSAQNGWFMM